MKRTKNLPKCNDERECIFQRQGKCKILRETYEDRPCPFCKEEQADA